MSNFSLVTARGSATPSPEGRDLLTRVSHALGQAGHTLRTPGVALAEKVALLTTVAAGGSGELWLPAGSEFPDWIREPMRRAPQRLRVVTMSTDRNAGLLAAARAGRGDGHTLTPTQARDLACAYAVLSQAETAIFYSEAISPRGRGGYGDLDPAVSYARSHNIPVADLSGIGGLDGLQELLERHELRLPAAGSVRAAVPMPPPPPFSARFEGVGRFLKGLPDRILRMGG